MRLLLTFIFIISVATSTWADVTKTMKIWKDGNYTSFEITDVDSITYSEDSLPAVIPVMPDQPSYMSMSEKDAQVFIAGLYDMLRNFMLEEQVMESMALGKETGQEYEINPRNQHIANAYNKAYSTIRNSNTLISHLENNPVDFDKYAYISHAWCIRGLIYYTLAKLWGDVPFMDEKADVIEMSNIKKLPAQTIINNSYHDFQKALSYGKFHSFGTDAAFNSSNINHIYKEIAYESTGTIEWGNDDANDFYIAGNDMNVAVKITDKTFYSLLVRSIMNLNYQTTENKADIAKAYMDLFPHYGIWHSLKRLGLAERHNGMAECNLFPFPQNEVMMIPGLTQNPGY